MRLIFDAVSACIGVTIECAVQIVCLLCIVAACGRAISFSFEALLVLALHLTDLLLLLVHDLWQLQFNTIVHALVDVVLLLLGLVFALL